MMVTEEQLVVVCLQAQRVAGLPAAAEGRQILLRMLHQQQQPGAPAAAAARCTAGVADFHDQVLLLHCAPASSIAAASLIAVGVSATASSGDLLTVRVDLAEQLRRPSPGVLTFVLGDGAVLFLALHHRRLPAHRRRSACLPDLLLSCVRMRTPTDDNQQDDGDNDGQSSSGFITIEKGTISRRHPPSDNLLATDDDDEPIKPPSTAEEELEVEEEFLAMLEAQQSSTTSACSCCTHKASPLLPKQD